MGKQSDKSEKTSEEKQLHENMKKHFFDVAMDEPLPWIKLDTSILEDNELQDLRDSYGKELCWDYVILISILAKHRRHVIDISTPRKLKRLCNLLEQDSVEQTEKFLRILGQFRLINNDALEQKMVINDRILRTAEQYAKNTTRAKYANWCKYIARDKTV